MKVLLTMAGLGSRFKQAGYQEEKYAIRFRDHTLFDWSLASLLNFRDSELVVITRDFPDIESFVQASADRLGFNQVKVIVLNRTTKGQAETAVLAEPAFDADDDILIYNTDTFIDPRYLKPSDIRGEGWIPTFNAPGDKWSFVEADDDGRAIRTTEKVRISEECSVGLYYFSSFFMFREIVRSAEFERELYVAPLYNEWIRLGHETFLHRLPAGSVTVLGTPEDLETATILNQPVWPDACI